MKHILFITAILFATLNESEWSAGDTILFGWNLRVRKCYCLVGTSEFDDKVFDIYPNPNTRKFFIDIPENLGQAAFSMYNTIGICAQTDLFDSKILDVSNQKSGLYITELST